MKISDSQKELMKNIAEKLVNKPMVSNSKFEISAKEFKNNASAAIIYEKK